MSRFFSCMSCRKLRQLIPFALHFCANAGNTWNMWRENGRIPYKMNGLAIDNDRGNQYNENGHIDRKNAEKFTVIVCFSYDIAGFLAAIPPKSVESRGDCRRDRRKKKKHKSQIIPNKLERGRCHVASGKHPVAG